MWHVAFVAIRTRALTSVFVLQVGGHSRRGQRTTLAVQLPGRNLFAQENNPAPVRRAHVVLTKTANPTVEQHFAEINPQKLAREEDSREGVERYSGGRFLSCPERLTCSHE